MLNWNKFKKEKDQKNKQSIDESWFLTGKKKCELNDIDFEIMEEELWQ